MELAEVFSLLVPNGIALIALGLSIWGFVLPYLKSRHADVVVRFTKEGSDTRVTISNYGACKATEVTLEFTNEDGSEWNPSMYQRDLRKPIPALWPGDTIAPSIRIAMGRHALIQAHVSWKDKRRKVQNRSSTVATYAIPAYDSIGAMRKDLDALLKEQSNEKARRRR